MGDTISCAALYFKPNAIEGVPSKWVESAVRILSNAHLYPQELSLETKDKNESSVFEFAAYRTTLMQEAAKKNLNVVGLYSNPNRSKGLVLDWRALAYIDIGRGNCFLGLPQSVESAPSVVLHSLHLLTEEFLPVDYGIGYYFQSSSGPDFFAVGIIANPARFDTEAMAEGDRVAKWGYEMDGPRRYLAGWFRDAYPANILSQLHMDARVGDGGLLRDAGVGDFFPMGEGTWSWEILERDIPRARELLRQTGRVICL